MALIVASHLPDEKPLVSKKHDVLPVECVSEFSYCDGLASVWYGDETLINVEHDMEWSDELADGLLSCPHPLCAYAYQVFPTQLDRFIYCATTDGPGTETPRWIEGPEDEWALWSSIGFCKITPEVRTKPLDRMFWKWLEHCVNRVVCETKQVGHQVISTRWHIHWPAIQHFHDYDEIPDHLW